MKNKGPFSHMKNPKFTPEQEAQIERAEQLSTSATIFELGCAEFLKTHMPCGADIASVIEVLARSIELRKESRLIHSQLNDQRPGAAKRKPRL